MEFVVYKPVASARPGVQGLAPRPDALGGKVIGLLWNAKVNADVYLRRIQERIAEKYQGVRFVFQSKPTASKPMAEEVFETLRRCDVVVNAFGD